MYRSTTHGIEVSVDPVFLPDRSQADENRYFWAYRVSISNQSPEAVQLVSRYWHITDANGGIQEVRGQGVVGEQPLIQPGACFDYTSGCALTTPSGIMVGHYIMLNGRGAPFEVAIPAFSLDLPNRPAVLN